jgi:hypothetical protein
MRFFDAGQHATGIIAIGQEATGVIAFGQMATGVIAIGQLARGCFVVGQLGFGFTGWGQLGLGVFHAAGMVGAGGRRGIGLVIPLVPTLGKPRELPPATPLAAVHQGTPGWVPLELKRDDFGLGLYEAGARLPIKLDRHLRDKAFAITESGATPVMAFTRRKGAVLVCERIAYEPPKPYQKKGFWAIAAIQTVALFGLAIGWWLAVGNDLTTFFGKVASDDSDVPAKTAPPPKTKKLK